jgi:hypothetical protein
MVFFQSYILACLVLALTPHISALVCQPNAFNVSFATTSGSKGAIYVDGAWTRLEESGVAVIWQHHLDDGGANVVVYVLQLQSNSCTVYKNNVVWTRCYDPAVGWVRIGGQTLGANNDAIQVDIYSQSSVIGGPRFTGKLAVERTNVIPIWETLPNGGDTTLFFNAFIGPQLQGLFIVPPSCA